MTNNEINESLRDRLAVLSRSKSISVTQDFSDGLLIEDSGDDSNRNAIKRDLLANRKLLRNNLTENQLEEAKQLLD